jgi:hypothetical protein
MDLIKRIEKYNVATILLKFTCHLLYLCFCLVKGSLTITLKILDKSESVICCLQYIIRSTIEECQGLHGIFLMGSVNYLLKKWSPDLSFFTFFPKNILMSTLKLEDILYWRIIFLRSTICDFPLTSWVFDSR